MPEDLQLAADWEPTSWRPAPWWLLVSLWAASKFQGRSLFLSWNPFPSSTVKLDPRLWGEKDLYGMITLIPFVLRGQTFRRGNPGCGVPPAGGEHCHLL